MFFDIAVGNSESLVVRDLSASGKNQRDNEYGDAHKI